MAIGIGFDAVLFDLDGTLCGYAVGPLEALRRALARRDARLEARLDPEAFEALCQAVWREGVRRTRAGEANPFPLGAGAEAVARWLAAEVDDAAARRALERAYLDALMDELRLLPGAEALLAALADRPLGLITNGPSALQWGKIDRLGLRRRFDAIVVSGDEGVHKPDPRVFAAALARLGVPAQRALFVGDSLVHDVAGAKGAGLKAVWIGPGGDPPLDAPAPDAIVPGLEALRAWLEEK